ncbi:uncharacterized protein LOC141627844 [Silene latifolia]|uniref:uncharacterized protein LOC141627844 n=1 Tax=Silene latifolia TaxID=37657 RepID=UPI003D779DF6
MDHEWMIIDRLDPRYMRGVDQFVKHAINHSDNLNEIYCPCVKCGNNVLVDVGDLRNHLLCNGIDKGYTRWIWHGEDVLPNNCRDSADDGGKFQGEYFDVVCEDRVDDMINDFKECTEDPHVFDTLASDALKPVYFGSKFTRLSATLKLYNLKAKNGWSDKSFTDLLHLLSEILPDGNELPKSTYEAKKILCPMGLNYVKIHACPNDCILYRKDYKDLNQCPKCGAARYKYKKTDSEKNKGTPCKMLWYLPIIPRFKRLFSNIKDAQNLVWHAEGRVQDDKIRHPADST